MEIMEHFFMRKMIVFFGEKIIAINFRIIWAIAKSTLQIIQNIFLNNSLFKKYENQLKILYFKVTLF